MAVINTASFECGDFSEGFGTSVGSGGSIAIVSSKRQKGDYGFRSYSTNGAAFYGLRGVSANGSGTDIGQATVYHKLDVFFRSLPTGGTALFLSALDGSAIKKLYFGLNTSGEIEVYSSTGATLFTTSIGGVVLDRRYLFEFKVGTGVSGAWELKLNGSSVGSGTANLLTSNNARLYLGRPSGQPGITGPDVIFDNWIANSTAYPGDSVMSLHLPRANGSSMAWTVGAGSGSEYTIVNQRKTDDDTTYLVSTGTTGDAALLSLQSCATVGNLGGTIGSLKIMALVKRDGSSNGSVKLRLRFGGVNYDATAFTTTSAYTMLSRVFEVRPSDSAAWTTTDLDNIEVGVVENSSNKSRVTLVQALSQHTNYVQAPQFPKGGLVLA